MTSSRIEPIMQHLRRTVLRQDGAGLTDGQLLHAFICRKDAAAFEGLVRRHGPMVLGVCRRILRDTHDAEDAFQATFLVLARKAAAVSPRERVGSWLHGVARTTAIRLRSANFRRRLRERQVADMPEPEEQTDLQDLHETLDEELARLPDKYRVPLVLCDLEGRARREVARQLRIPEGTLSSRLTTGRRMLARRLARRGLEASGGALAAALSQSVAGAGVPTALVSSTVKAAGLVAAGQAATELVSVPVAALAEGVLRAMFLAKVKTFLGVMLVVAALGSAAGLVFPTRAAEPPKARRATASQERQKQASASKDQKPQSDKERLQGTWKVISVIVDGEKERDNDVWTFKDATLRARSPATEKTGSSTAYFRFRLDETSSPKWIDLVEGKADDLFDLAAFERSLDEANKRSEGIYRIAGNRLTICINGKPGERPAAFESKRGSERILIVLRRMDASDIQRGTKEPGEDRGANLPVEKVDFVKQNVQVRFPGPPGMKVAILPSAGKGSEIAAHEAPVRINLEPGKVYRLLLADIPNRPGVELFPTLEIPKVDAATQTFVTVSAIPVSFTNEDFERVQDGTAITKVVYLRTETKGLEPGERQGEPDTILSYNLEPDGDVIAEAKRRGAILAVVRMGNIDLGAATPKTDKGQVNRPGVRRPELVPVEIGNDGVQGHVLRRGKRADREPGNIRAAALADQLEKVLREAASVQAENEALRQRLKEAELEIRSLRDRLERKEREEKKPRRRTP